ncbi:NUDIX domain-containing protein [Streptomyces sp. JV176]|uniref:NUDIX domain-containing protein n=1 Tax=Streptomyces sp. JV176 TaxID=858630 RepID=UPI002E76B379|nr:NUDIX domain-containing protein [Streptomyces sp. JV176]MEE1800177.1 NUDIX domain-containing protein [Streptomyces sp. JV176]
MSAADEILDIVDENDHVIGQAPRGEAYAKGLTHRSVFVFVRDPRGLVFVHRRTPDKLAFPSMYDMFVGGVVGAGEGYDEAALREAEEELGVSGLDRPVPLFSFRYVSPGPGEFRSWSRVYEVVCALPVHPQVEEIAWHAFIPEEELERRLAAGPGGWEWVPDGVEAYERLKALRAGGTADATGSGRAGPAPRA